MTRFTLFTIVKYLCAYTIQFIMYRIWTGFLIVMLLGCSGKRSVDNLQLFAGNIQGIISIDLRKTFQSIDQNYLLSLPIFRDQFEGTRFQNLLIQVMDAPKSCGIDFLKPFYFIFNQIEDDPNIYAIGTLSNCTKFEKFLIKIGYNNHREFDAFKVLVVEPLAIAWDKNNIIICQSKLMPTLIENIRNNEVTDRQFIKDFFDQSEKKAVLSLQFKPGITNIWSENKDRLMKCELSIDDIDQQHVFSNLFVKNEKGTLDINFNYSGSWYTFWKTFFNQNNTRIESIKEISLKGTLFTSVRNPLQVESMLLSPCPISLLEKYLSIPSKEIIRQILPCIESTYGIYLPEFENNFENHIVFFKAEYPQHIYHMLEELLPLHLGENEIRTVELPSTDKTSTIYYTIKDSLLLLSRNALNLLKINDDLEILQNSLNHSPYHNGVMLIQPKHFMNLFESGDTINTFFGPFVGNILDNRLWLKMKSANSNNNFLKTVLDFFNYQYINNQQFYESWDRQNIDSEIEL
jgi:hypothetical protein